MSDVVSNRGWRDYWRENRLAACVPENPQAAAAIEAHWTAFFAALPDGSRILDIATGNGVLLVWARRAARAAGRDFDLTGVDLADIDPTRFLDEHADDLAAVRFLGRTAAETLPFDDGSFDVVVSQYGLEYASLAPAVSEAARVLAGGGQLHVLAHSHDSVVVAQGRERLRDIDLLLAGDGPFAAMGAFIEAQARRRKVNRATRALTEALRRAQSHCDTHPPATLVRELCGAILATANDFERYEPQDATAWLEENRKRLLALRQRVRDLLAARLTPARSAELEALLAAAPWCRARAVTLTVGSTDVSVGRLVTADHA